MGAQVVTGRAAALGAALTLGVLAISVWLRVNTSLDATGSAVTHLAATTQELLRRIHRVAAAGEGLVVLALAALLVRDRASARVPWSAFAVVVAATLVLSAVGRLTPGYRLAWVTVANVTGAIVLMAAFWRIRESSRAHDARRDRDAFAIAAAALALLQGSFGAMASAASLREATRLDPWHAGSGLVVLAFCIVAAARASHARIAAKAVVAAAVVVQFVTGFRLAAMGEAGAAPCALLHALGAALLVVALLGLARRPRMNAQ